MRAVPNQFIDERLFLRKVSIGLIYSGKVCEEGLNKLNRLNVVLRGSYLQECMWSPVNGHFQIFGQCVFVTCVVFLNSYGR